MYQSRIHATNGILSLALDALNGEVLELVRESTWDNVAKNHVQKAYSLLEGILHTEETDLRFHVPRYLEIAADESLKPLIRVEQRETSATVSLHYPALMCDTGKLAISAGITIELGEEEARSVWRLSLDNRTEYEIYEVAFPSLNGMWLGESWQDDILVLPRFAGWKAVNPTLKLASPPCEIHWKWQEYLYTYALGELSGIRDDRGAYTAALSYAGDASMLWMDLYDPTENTGIYMTCRNTSLTMKGLRVLSFGEQDPGIGMAVVHKPCLKRGEWKSEDCVVALHEGDWHWAADDYRAWFASLGRPAANRHSPSWFEKSAGLMAHYDFQYQLGGIVHTFRDIPELYRQARDLGLHHLLLSGWNKDGFDYGFPHYTPNPLLGSEEELREAIQQVRGMGGHVAFYINSRLCNTAFADEQEQIRQSAVMNRNGSLYIEKYGAANVSFASMCINEPAWRQRLAHTVRYLTHDIGADSIYLDQLAMAPSLKCYHPAHAEHTDNPTAWNQGYEKLLSQLCMDTPPEGVALLYEGCNDIFGPRASGQLISSMSGPFIGRFPEVYKYTFPDQILVDMMNPRRHSAMRPEHIARHSTEFLYKAFVMGSYFWCYDLEWDNTWRRDPEQAQRLKKVIALRVRWLENYGHGRFTDTVGILRAPAEPMIKRFELEDGLLLACACDSTLCGQVAVSWKYGRPPKAVVMTMDQPDAQPLTDISVETIGGTPCALLSLPHSEMAVIVLRI